MLTKPRATAGIKDTVTTGILSTKFLELKLVRGQFTLETDDIVLGRHAYWTIEIVRVTL